MKITISEDRNRTSKENICDIAVLSTAAAITAAGFVMNICSMIHMEVSGAVIVAAAAVSAVCCSGAVRSKFGNAAVIMILAAVLCGGCVLLNSYFINGALTFINAAADTLGNNSHIIISRYELISEDASFRDFSIFVIISTVLTGGGFHLLLRVGKLPVMVLIMAAAVMLICADVNDDAGAKAVLAAGLICSGIYRAYFDVHSKGMKNRASMAALCCAGAILLAGAVSALTVVFFPADDHEQNELMAGIREGISYQIEAVRYGGNKINTLPEGDLQRAETWEGSEKTALEVMMDKPQSLYLRGFVGSVYESDAWHDLEKSVCYGSRNLFYGLEEYGFSADTQLATLRGLLTDSNLEDQRVELTIENKSADREYLYTPYELTELDERTAENDGDAYQKSRGLFGERTYSMTSLGNLVKDFPQLASEGYIRQVTGDETEYTDAESHYNVFVYENYTSVPDGLVTLFEKELGYNGEEEEDHINYYSAIQKIRVYLESRMTYSDHVQELPENEDFIEYFIEESRIGNPVHYATTAAMMFRYLGIPSRYVEGYVITPDDVDAAAEGKAVEVPGTNGHAWVEIYIDGTGWVPVEMTPEYYDLMEQPDFTKGLEPTSTIVLEEPDDTEKH